MVVIVIAVLILILLAFYVVISLFPEYIAYILAKNVFQYAKPRFNSTWLMLENLQRKRHIIIVLLFGLLSLVAIANILVFSAIFPILESTQAFLVFALILPAIIYGILQIGRFGSHHFEASPHKRESEVRDLINSLSIAAGHGQPEFFIIANTNPTAFSLEPRGKPPTIFLTSGLLNLTDHSELEAVLAHEIAHITSGRLLEYRHINYLLTLLKSFSITLLIIILAIPSKEIAEIFAYLIFAAITTIANNDETASQLNIETSKLINVLNPPFSIINFISKVIEYILSQEEDRYADLQAIQLTRNPQGLYAVLDKIQNDNWLIGDLPTFYSSLYFTGESVAYQDIPQSQPTIDERKAVLQDLDTTLKAFTKSKITSGLVCLYCGTPMKEIEGQGHYGGKAIIDQCPQCGSMWFDNWELYYVANLLDLSSKLPPHPSTDQHPDKEYICPHCGINLILQSSKKIPESIHIWYCNSCQGNFLEYSEVREYSEYRNKLLNG